MRFPKKYQYKPKLVDEIIVRKFDFDFPDRLNPEWIPNKPVRSYFWNGISLTMPYLEPYLVKTNHEALAYIENEDLLKDIRNFNAQEIAHFKCHRKVNELLKQNGCIYYNEVERKIESHYRKLSKKKVNNPISIQCGF